MVEKFPSSLGSGPISLHWSWGGFAIPEGYLASRWPTPDFLHALFFFRFKKYKQAGSHSNSFRLPNGRTDDAGKAWRGNRGTDESQQVH